MELLFLILIFAGIFSIYDAIRKLNSNLLEQTEEIKKMREELMRNNTK
ncbi:hypothetical protein [Ornithinibacillus californiensis]|nr:hypothetical protein [Ornithinibacillus californiensis]